MGLFKSSSNWNFHFIIDASGNPVTQSVVSVTDANGNPVTGKIKEPSLVIII